jgi:hypothetical protein
MASNRRARGGTAGHKDNADSFSCLSIQPGELPRTEYLVAGAEKKD